MDGLVDLFLAEGFLGFNIGDLASRLQCSKSTLYEIAPSKEQLITAVVRAFFKRATARVEAEVAQESDPVARIGTYLDAIARELAPATDEFFANLQQFAPARDLYSENTAIAARRVQGLVREATVPDTPVNAAFVGMVTAQVMESIQRGEMEAMTGLDDATAYHLLADLIVKGIAAQPDRKSR